MKITQRQLKRIIREEYTNLSRRGLIREFGPPTKEDLEDYEYDESGAKQEFSEDVQKAVQATKKHLQQRMDKNLKFVEYTLNDMFQRLAKGGDEYLEEDDYKGGYRYSAGSVFQEKDTPFKLTEINWMSTRFIEEIADSYGISVSWSYSWD